MKYLIVFLITISATLFALKIEDNTTAVKTQGIASQQGVASKEKGHNSKEKEKEKNIQSDNSQKTDIEPIREEDFIMPKAEDMGRVFVIPNINFNSVFSGTTDSFFTAAADFEYNTGLIYNQLAVYGSIGAGSIDKFFLLHLEGGAKYNLPRLTRFMKPFIKLGLALSPYFTSSSVYIPSTFVAGAGFKFFITNNFAIEETQDFQIGKEINEGDFNMFLRFKLGIIFIF